MCYNCGCGLPHDDMGVGHALAEPHGHSITEKTFTELAKQWSMDVPGVRELLLGLLTGEKKDAEKEHVMEHLYKDAADSQGMSVDEAKKETLKLLQKQIGKN